MGGPSPSLASLRDVLVSRMANGPSPGRTRHLLSPILFPAEEPPESGHSALD
jgi:hypothetical protein